MEFRDTILQIVEESSTLQERLEQKFVPTDQSNPDLQFFLGKWRERAALGDPAMFEKRLRLDGLDQNNAARLIGPVRMASSDLPKWANTLIQVLQSTRYDESNSTHAIPFEEMLWSIVLSQTERLDAATDLLSPTAVKDLQLGLLRSLSHLCSPVFVLEMNLSSRNGLLQGSSAEERYKDYVRSRLGTGDLLIACFAEYPVLGRLVAHLLDFWVDATGEFLLRLKKDLAGIARRFNQDADPGEVVTIIDHLSDPHRGGRTVKQVLFASGLRVMYKPRSTKLEEEFQNIFAWINEATNTLDLKTINIWSRQDYGWTEFIPHRTCGSEIEVEHFFERAGMLMCLFYAFGLTDCHFQNVIASGEYPVLIDIETLATELETVAINAREVAEKRCSESVLRTGLLPMWRFDERGRKGVNLGGLSDLSQEMAFLSATWLDSKTDVMSLSYEHKRVKVNPASPFPEGDSRRAADYTDQIVKGFRTIYEFLLTERGQAKKIHPQVVRYVPRPTFEYALTLMLSLKPYCLRNGINRSIELDRMSERAVVGEQSNWNNVKQEIAELEELQIPYFIRQSAPNTTELSKNDLMQQISFIRAALLTISFEDHGVQFTDETLPVSDSVLLNEASDIADQIKESAVHGSDGSITWISPTYLHSEGQFQLQPVESGMYGGCAGTALFLAAMENFSPGNGFGDFALKAIKSVQFDMNANCTARSRLLQNGLSSGIPGICYCLSIIGELLGNKELLQLACTYSEQINEDLIRNDSCFDILEGTTGTLLALLRLHRLSPTQSLLDRAILCGEHLLHHRSATLSGNRAWKISGKLLTGFSHGAAGIGYALMRLYERTGIMKFQQTAKEAFDYEASVFVESESNWPDFRSSPAVFMNSWCHGATGIALSRAAAIAVMDTPFLRRDLNAALSRAADSIPGDEDDLCCGNAGRIEALLYSSAALSSDDLRTQARNAVAQMLSRKQERGRYAILYKPEHQIYNTGFFKGIAGIGYTLLRLHKAGSDLPSVLAID